MMMMMIIIHSLRTTPRPGFATGTNALQQMNRSLRVLAINLLRRFGLVVSIAVAKVKRLPTTKGN
jgi:hypothetical protein